METYHVVFRFGGDSWVCTSLYHHLMNAIFLMTKIVWDPGCPGLLMQMHYLSIFTNPKIAGLALWQFADIPIDRAVSNDEHRPRGLNNKGT